MARLVIVSNRVPAPRERGNLAGGLAVALRDAIRGRETMWFGWSGGTVGGDDEPPAPGITTVGQLTFATLDLPEKLFRGYYEGFSNGMLWPLLHSRMGLAEFRRTDLEAYYAVNEAFARALAPLLRPDDLVWVHDYQLIPLGAALRRAGVTARIGFFLHVPFPASALFLALPQADRLLRDFAAYDLVGVQVPEDADHLTESLDAIGIDAPTARAFPIGINPKSFATTARKAETGSDADRLRQSLGDRALIIGVDRLDYSKGIPHRFRGFAQLLKRFPEHRNHVTMIQIAPVSRGDVAQYRALRKELDELAGRINGENAEFDWVPLRYLTRAVPRNTLAGFYRKARIGLVTPLRDGMNLVAKEYVAAQEPADPGALVLSRFAGAAIELDGAVLVNPYDPDETAEALHHALRMPLEERQERWRRMMDAVETNTASAWARNFVSALEDRPARG
ncbi:MAG: trehalose-6-phosphate synthase [Acetobacteraceae bacterium]|nr:trehalose-6-phosphate synthase [Acetobacteraceae bacterium]